MSTQRRGRTNRPHTAESGPSKISEVPTAKKIHLVNGGLVFSQICPYLDEPVRPVVRVLRVLAQRLEELREALVRRRRRRGVLAGPRELPLEQRLAPHLRTERE